MYGQAGPPPSSPVLDICSDIDPPNSVSNRMGVSIEHLTHNTPNSLLLEGARRLGMDAKTVPQNSGGHSHSCGNCCYGCHSNQKQSTTATYLVDACLAGAKCITSCKATQLLFSGTTITGITATLSSGQPIHIATPRVVLAAGSLQTPLLLSASGFQHPHLGKNLRIHPCTNIFIFFPAHAKTHPYRGPILSALLAETSNLDGAGYGSRGIVLPNHPGFAGAQLPWTDAATWQGRVDRYDQSILATSMVRDHDSSASVSADASGEPAVRFSFGAGDRRAGVEGLVALARCYVEMGAEEVVVDARGVGAWRRGDEFEDWVAELRRVGLQDRKASSAHQLGTARMAARREDGVCDPRGRVWRTEGLWVADGSLCPTATGVNPMVTIMGLAEYVADGVVEDFRKGGD